MKTARVIITTECQLKCDYCCNKIPEIQQSFKMTTFDEFVKMDYDVINISGGEPTLVPDKLLRLVTNTNQRCRVYLYTNGVFNTNISAKELSNYINGVNIGCHSNFDRAFMGAISWRYYTENVRFHIQEGKITKKQKEQLFLANIELKEWKMNDCNNTEEDRWII